ncbi:Lectin-domain containing receptor kinase A4.3 [Hordeum vulgare]|nr:Lectin-domain containing receptor kinase A4.3 [Hordeum vulgare]
MQSTCGWVSISKRWKVIQQECNKFCATYESIKARPVSDIGMQDMAFQALEAFKVQHEGKSFNLSHCCRIIKDEEKFNLQYAALTTHGGKESVEEVGEGGDHEDGSQHRVVKEEAMVLEDAGRHAQLRR